MSGKKIRQKTVRDGDLLGVYFGPVRAIIDANTVSFFVQEDFLISNSAVMEHDEWDERISTHKWYDSWIGFEVFTITFQDTVDMSEIEDLAKALICDVFFIRDIERLQNEVFEKRDLSKDYISYSNYKKLFKEFSKVCNSSQWYETYDKYNTKNSISIAMRKVMNSDYGMLFNHYLHTTNVRDSMSVMALYISRGSVQSMINFLAKNANRDINVDFVLKTAVF